MSIQPLPPDVIAQIKSSTTITNLNGVISELAKNSLDAGSTRIDITVDYRRGGCIVEDNGLGILPSEFAENGGLGKLYHSSKLHSPSPTHGGKGTFLASLAALSLLSITSHHHLYHSHNSTTLHKSEVVARQTPALARQHLSHYDHGTRVTVRDLFGSMPVRVKQRAFESDSAHGKTKVWESLRRDVVALLLAWPDNVSITAREVDTDLKFMIRPPATQPNSSSQTTLVDVSNVCRILTQASYISATEVSSWVHVSASTTKIAVNGAISLQPSATKLVQFLALGIEPLLPSQGHNILYDEINRLFSNSAFGIEGEEKVGDSERSRRAHDRRYKGDGYTNNDLKGGRKGVDRWPMFYINIQFMTSSKTRRDVEADDVLDDKGNSLSVIQDVLQLMLHEFLTRNHFRPRAQRGNRTRKDPEVSRGIPSEMNNLLQIQRSQSTPPSVSSCPLIDSSKFSSANSTSNESNLSRHRHFKGFEVMARNVKLPILKRHSSHPDSPFGHWSRVKSGTISTKFVKLTEAHAPSAIKKDAKDYKPKDVSSTTNTKVRGEDEHSKNTVQPLVSKSGKVMQRPFKDVYLEKHQRLRTLSQQDPNSILSSDQNVTDSVVEEDLVTWVNPVTKVRSLVDRRTGNVVPASKDNVSRQSAVAIRGRLLTGINLSPSDKEPSPWLSEILKDWNNPVFRPAELAIPQMSFNGPNAESQKILHGRHHHCSHLDITKAFTESSVGLNGRISKDALRCAEVISQVDRKFMLVKLGLERTIPEPSASSLLVIIDQHAADERIRIETLMEELCTPSPDTTQPSIQSIPLDKPLAFDISSKEIQILRAHIYYFITWGIIFDLPPLSETKTAQHQKLVVRSLPPGIIERCKIDPKLLIELIRTEAWNRSDKRSISIPKQQTLVTDPSKHAWLERINDCPRGIVDMLNSRACRSAIMFNDELSNEQCTTLVQRLAECAFPFQCAHGRPSMVPLVDLSILRRQSPRIYDGERSMSMANGKGSFGAAFRRWKNDLH